MIEAQSRPYSVDPAYLEHIGSTLRQAAEQSVSFAETCENIAPVLAENSEIDGLDNIPTEGTLIVVKNHPFHFDALMLGALFAKRPDIRLLVKAAPYTLPLPASNAILLRKDGAKADPADIAALQSHLMQRGSLLATPWGALDHEAKSYTSRERAARNAAQYVAYGNATLLPVHIDVIWGETRGLPVKNAHLSIQEPIMAADDETNTRQIYGAVTSMYERYAA